MENKEIRQINLRSLVEFFLLFFIFIVPVWPEFAAIKFGNLPDINLQRMLFIPLAGSWFLFLLQAGNGFREFSRIVRSHYGIFILLLLFFTLNFITVFRSQKAFTTLYASLNELFYLFTVFLITVSIINRPAQIRRIFLVLISSGLIVTIIGLVEYAMGENIFRHIIPISNENVQQALALKSRESYRIQATFSNPLALAQYIILIMPVGIYTVLHSRYPVRKIAAALFIILGLINIWLTVARTPLLVILMVALILLVKSIYQRLKKNRGIRRYRFVMIVMPMILILLYFSAIFMMGIIRGRTEMEYGSSMVRLLQLKKGIPLVVQKPFIGYGRGMSAEEIQVGRISSDHYTVDNYYLTIAVESGLTGLFLFISIFYYFYRISKTPNACHNEMKALHWAIVGFIIFMTALSLKQSFPLVFIIFALILAIHYRGKTWETA